MPQTSRRGIRLCILVGCPEGAVRQLVATLKVKVIYKRGARYERRRAAIAVARARALTLWTAGAVTRDEGVQAEGLARAVAIVLFGHAPA